MDWAEVKIYTATEGIEAVTGTLVGLGISGFVIQDAQDFEEFLADKTGNWDYIDDDLLGLKGCETNVTIYLPKDAAGAELLGAVRAEIESLKAADTDGRLGRLAIDTGDIRDEDWENNWKRYFKPIEIGDKLLIKPSWEQADPSETRKILEIDPASTFGTGQHDTTRLCLELIEKHVREGDSLLDLGCGSGILSLGAMLLGAKDVFAVDITEDSIRITKENFAKNNFAEDKLRCMCGDITSDEQLRRTIGAGCYQLVCANIVADVLIAMSPYFMEFLAPGGRLILSGIIDARLDEVLGTIKAQGFKLIEHRRQGDWNAAYFEIG